MATFSEVQLSATTDTAVMPAARRLLAMQAKPARIALRLASIPASVYGWASGPATTNLERERATLADVRNSRRGRTILV